MHHKQLLANIQHVSYLTCITSISISINIISIVIVILSPLAQCHKHDNTEVREMCIGCNGVSCVIMVLRKVTTFPL